MQERDQQQDQKGSTDNVPKPDEETLHTPDPQKGMEGPMSSSMKGIGHAFNTSESKEEADEKKDRKM